MRPRLSGSAPAVSGGGTKIGTGGAFTAAHLDLKHLIQIAYRVQGYQIVGGPAWVESETYDINAKPEVGVPPERRTDPNTNPVLFMLQSMFSSLITQRDRPKIDSALIFPRMNVREVGFPEVIRLRNESRLLGL